MSDTDSKDNVVPFPQADREQIKQFVEVIFAKADPGTWINIQAVIDIKRVNESFAYNDWRQVRRDEGFDAIVDAALPLAQRCAANKRATVFCPPVCTFGVRSGKSDTPNLANGLCIVAEIDANPGEHQKKLQLLLGPATLIVESGGMDGTEPKVHLYFVLDEPTRTEEEHNKLRLVRELICKYLGEGADTAAIAVVHPMRWAGSWHKKNPDNVRMARIVGGQSARRVKLDECLDLLQEELGWIEIGEVHQAGDPTAPIAKLASALEVYKNSGPHGGLEWEYWNKVGMILWRATAHSDEGKALWCAWSATSSKDNAAATAKRWEDYKKSPPTIIGAGSLFYWARQIDPNWLPPSEVIAEVNREYAVVLVGNKTVVLREGFDADDSPEWRLITVASFKQWTATKSVGIPTKTGMRRVALADHWLRHQQRRQYENVVFAPKRDLTRHYNLWRGFPFEPVKGKCDLFLDHVRNVAASGHTGAYEWIMAWFADIVQNPAIKQGTAVVFRGPQGTGKTIMFDEFGSLLGDHYVKVTDPRYITGKFNSHLTSCLLLFADEGFWAGDKAAEGKLRDLITGEHQFIEFKNVEPIRVNNYIRLGVASHHDWVFPAGFGERRAAMWDVADTHKEDFKYFKAIKEQMTAGGRSALLWHLLHEVDVSAVNLRQVPKTALLLEQKELLFDDKESWWFDTLQRGDLEGAEELGLGIVRVPSQILYDDYVSYAKRRNMKFIASQDSIGRFLAKVTKGERGGITKKKEPWVKGYSRVYVYTVPPLDVCRERFAAAVGQPMEWHDALKWNE